MLLVGLQWSYPLVVTADRSMAKWVVMESNARHPTTAILTYAMLPGWHLLVVGGAQSLPHEEFMHRMSEKAAVEYLDLSAQQQLPWRLAPLLPQGSAARKNLGYLYAIHKGARLILDAADDSIPDAGLIKVLQSESNSMHLRNRSEHWLWSLGQGVDSSPFINVYAYFGRPGMWPRGFPLEKVGETSAADLSQQLYLWDRRGSPCHILPGLINGAPDVDAVFRMTQTPSKPAPQIYFDGDAPPVALRPHAYCPFNSANTLFHADAFWALYLSASTTSRVTDIWRSYIAQRLLWDIDSCVAFLPANVYRPAPRPATLDEFRLETQLYNSSAALVELLENFRCDADHVRPTTIATCLLSLTQLLAAQGFWHPTEVAAMRAWIDDLNGLGYRWPLLEHTPPSASPLVLAPPPRPLQHRAPASSRSPLMSDDMWSRILVCVVFNFGHYEAVPSWMALWGSVFPHVAFFGPTNSSSAEMAANFGVIENGDPGGLFNYNIPTLASSLFPHFDGYLVMHDDLFINIDGLMTLDPTKIWLPGPGGPFERAKLSGWHRARGDVQRSSVAGKSSHHGETRTVCLWRYNL
jgi:hypothetical protein